MKPLTFLRKDSEKGFAMLFAVLTSSVLLSIGLSIFGLTLKEIELSSGARESQFAFYAADTGIECAMYHDGKRAFATSSESASMSGISCLGENISPILDGSNLTSATTTFSFTLPPSGTTVGRCVNITVNKVIFGAQIITTIDSRGNNTTCLGGLDPNRIERAIRVKY